MDIFSHAIVGAATGALFSHPLLGAAAAVLPDTVLPIYKRLAEPNTAYRATHSLLFVCFIFGLFWVIDPSISFCIASSWLSHIALDIPTHGALWSPRLLWPLSDKYVGQFEEWEFCNKGFLIGFVLTVLWVVSVALWLILRH